MKRSQRWSGVGVAADSSLLMIKRFSSRLLIWRPSWKGGQGQLLISQCTYFEIALHSTVKKTRRIYLVKAKNNTCAPSWRFDLVVSTARRFGRVVVCLVLQLWNIRNLGCFSWNVFESQICLPVTRKDKKGITTKSVKGAKEAVENLSVEYFIGTFWLLIVYKELFLLF